MSQTHLTKALVIASFLAFTGAGLYAADRVYRPAAEAVEIAALPGPAVQREADAIPTPRECEPEKGIDQNCTY